MRTVKISKDRLAAKVRENRDAHIAEHREAMAEWTKIAISALEARALLLAEPSPPADKTDLQFHHLPKPESHADEYERVLQMLAFSAEDTVELTEYEFKNYVQDDWDWTHAVKSVNSNYRH